MLLCVDISTCSIIYCMKVAITVSVALIVFHEFCKLILLI